MARMIAHPRAGTSRGMSGQSTGQEGGDGPTMGAGVELLEWLLAVVAVLVVLAVALVVVQRKRRAGGVVSTRRRRP
jgi:hypothetical protein